MGLTGHHLAKLSDRELIFLAEVWGRAGPPDSLSQHHRDLAREQLRAASWGGYEFDECDCFLISVPPLPEASRISHDGGPFSVLEVSRAGEGLGHLELWVVDGYLHSVDYMTFGDHEKLPALEEVSLELLD